MENLASQYTVLVVDDVPTNVMLVQAILKKEGYTLLTTDSGAKALRIAQERHPNLILLDIMMPEMDGYEVLQHLKSNPETNNIPVIIMSALSDMQSIVKGYQLGARICNKTFPTGRIGETCRPPLRTVQYQTYQAGT